MIHLLMLLMLSPAQGGIPERFMIPRDQGTATPVTDKDLRPVRPPDCKTDEETARAVAQVRAGEPGECFVRDVSAFNRR